MESENEMLGKITNAEIMEIPDSIRRTIGDKAKSKKIRDLAQSILNYGCESIYCLGSGTSYHAGLISTYVFNYLAKIPTHCELAPEFPYLVEPIVREKHCVICISQSGESELTIYSAKKAKEKGAFVVGITNTADSKMIKVIEGPKSSDKINHGILLTYSGEEKSVLATKTFVTQVVVLTALAIELAFIKKSITPLEYEELMDELRMIPKLIEMVMPNYKKRIKEIAPYFKFSRQCFVIGAGPDYANCMEAALKLKEGAQIFAQAFSTAEFPHGPITLADPTTCWVLCIFPPPNSVRRHADVLKLIKNLKKRGVTILSICNRKDEDIKTDIKIDIPKCSETFHSILTIIPIQMLVVEIAIIQNINPDTPKFLSKVSGL